MDYDPFDKSVAVPLVGAQWIGVFRDLAGGWPDRTTARLAEDYVHEADLQRAAGPVVFSATMPGEGGTLVTVPAAGLVTWSPSVPGPVGARTVPQLVAGALCTSGCAWSTRPGSR